MIDRIVTKELEAQANEGFADALPDAVIAIAHTAKYGDNAKLRLDAAKYIIERCMGKVPDKVKISAWDPVKELLASVISVSEAEAEAAEEKAILKAKAIREQRKQQEQQVTVDGNS